MVRKLFCLSSTLVLFLALLAAPALCARGRLGLHHPYHVHPRLHQQLHSSTRSTDANTIPDVQIVTANAQKSSNAFVRAPGHMVIPDNVEGSIVHMDIPPQEVDSMNMVASPSSAVASALKASMYWSSQNLDSYPTEKKRSLLDPSGISSSHHALQGGTDLSMLLPGFSMQNEESLFNMLPRARRVPPSGPSRDHNSILTDKSD